MTVRFVFRPITTWPGERTREPRYSRFRAAYSDTIDLLTREVEHLDGRIAVIQLALREEDIRLDGLPRANARPAHHGVILSFDSRHGSLRYSTDRYPHWQDNLRAIALALQALRAVDRYGVGTGSEQYHGWRALEAGDQGPDPDRGRLLIDRHGGVREALRATHPDHGGDPRDFRDVIAARDEEDQP